MKHFRLSASLVMLLLTVGMVRADERAVKDQSSGALVWRPYSNPVQWQGGINSAGFAEGDGTLSVRDRQGNLVAVFGGTMTNGRLSGSVTAKYLGSPDRASYVGEFSNWSENGKGTMTYKNGTIATGEWQDGELVTKKWKAVKQNPIQHSQESQQLAGSKETFDQEIYTVRNVAKGDILNVRSGPAMKTSTVFTLTNGQEVLVRGDSVMNGQTEWVPIRVDTRVGWVAKKFLISKTGVQMVGKNAVAKNTQVVNASEETNIQTNEAALVDDPEVRVNKNDDSYQKSNVRDLSSGQAEPPASQMQGRSGLRSWDMTGSYNEKGTATERKISVKGVNIWFVNGGTEVTEFSVQEVRSGTGESLSFETKIEKKGNGQKQAVLVVDGKYRLIPVGPSLYGLTFQEEKDKPSDDAAKGATSGSRNVVALEVVKEKAYQLQLQSGWTRTKSLPQGIDVGFRKKTAEGDYATFYFHHEVMPPEAGEPPSNTSDMKRQWDTMVRNQYPDARSVGGTVPKVGGRILINGEYELTDDGKKVRRRYTYFLAGRSAFVVQSSSVPSQWASVLADFDSMLASLQPSGLTTERETISDEAAKAEVKRNIPTLLGSLPSLWQCSLSDVTITSSSSKDKRTLVIALSFARTDIAEIFNATKTVFGIMKAGKTDSDLNRLPPQTQKAAESIGEFVKYVGQVWGAAWVSVANVSPEIERYTLPIIDSTGHRIGSISISKEDGASILTGKVTASDAKRVASMYVFE